MPRLIDDQHCPHCGAELPDEKPRVCPACAGSLQQRFLRAGCLSSAPLAALALAGAWAAAGGASEARGAGLGEPALAAHQRGVGDEVEGRPDAPHASLDPAVDRQ